MVERYLDDIVQAVVVSHAVSSFKILKQEVGEEDGYIRIKCLLSDGDILEFAEYVQVIRNKIDIVTYSFHWQTGEGSLMKRWDNVKHHKELTTFPYHLHLPDGEVVDSIPMNYKKILAEIEKTVSLEDEK